VGIPFAVFAEAGLAGGDVLFQPVEGMRIAIDMSAHDSDELGVMNGILGLSNYNFDTSYQTPKDWTHTWIGSEWTPVGVPETNKTVPLTFELQQNYPNPFNPITTIEYSIDKNYHVQLNIYNLLGQRIRILVDEMQTAGFHSIQWNGRDNQGVSLASGLYIYQLKTEKKTLQRKLMLLK